MFKWLLRDVNRVRQRDVAVIAAGVALLCAILLLQLPAVTTAGGEVLVLDRQGRGALAVLCFTALLWASEALPLAVSSLVGCVLLAVVGAAPWEQVIRSGMTSDTLPFLVGISITSDGLRTSGLADRMACAIVSRRPMGRKAMVLAFLFLGCALSMVVGNMASVAVVAPMAAAIIGASEDMADRVGFAKALMIACAWGPTIGSIGTPVGSSTGIMTIGFLDELGGVQVDLARWAAVGVPAALGLVLAGWLILIVRFRTENTPVRCRFDGAGGQRGGQVQGPVRGLSQAEWAVIVGLAVTWGVWTLLPEAPLSLGAIIGAILYIVTRTKPVRWNDIEHSVSMTTLVIVVAGLSIGSAVHQTTAGRWLGSALFSGVLSMPPLWGAAATAGMVILIKMFFSSNTATASLILPILISLKMAAGPSPVGMWQFVAPAALTSSLPIILVTSSPANLMAYRPGYFTVKDMAGPGLVLAGAATLVVAVVVTLFG
ncbi:MAG: Sodium-dependent dicarboxylate transporter SdcS [Firmicutes bacterium ADurb.Bin506]|nr:MAG: Sodium-dependent dicarboxylate transporter SdcS [Firmicutes bacterium ADurb.Bin506]